MDAPSKWTVLGGVPALFLVLLFPAWEQIYQGHPLPYKGELGHHFVFHPPEAVGEQSWMVNAPASDCQVKLKTGVLLRQSTIVVAMTTILVLALRFPAPHGSLAASLTARRLATLSCLLALCLPVPPPVGIPSAWYVAMAPIAPFMDNGHLGPWFIPMIAGISFGIYFAALFVLTSGVAWLIRRRTRPLSPSA
jgi:hypothetical protein